MTYSIKPEVSVCAFNVDAFKNINLGQNICVLYSSSVGKKFGVNKVISSLGQGNNIKTYNHVRPDAPFSDLDLIIDDWKGEKVDSIIAIGGGSIIDAAKTLSVSLNGVNYQDIFYKKAEMPTTKIPVVAVPTTAGTGAEMSFGAIIYDEKNKIKGGLRGPILQPDYVIIDPKLHNACPYKLKAEVGFDCLTHAVETYVSKKSSPIVKLKSVECIKAVIKYLPKACSNSDEQAMEKLAIHSALMGINLAYSSTCLPHRLQYVIGPLTGTSHAQGLISLYKGWLRHLESNSTEAFLSLCNDLDTTPSQFIETIDSLKQELNINYSLSTLGIKENQIEYIVENVSGNLSADPSYINKDSIINILKLSL
jgi:alcohol dehydrogenase class IV